MIVPPTVNTNDVDPHLRVHVLPMNRARPYPRPPPLPRLPPTITYFSTPGEGALEEFPPIETMNMKQTHSERRNCIAPKNLSANLVAEGPKRI